MEKRILHLTLKKKWFDLIKSGEKTVEYRTVKEYWTCRLLDESSNVKVYDEIYFKNGYSKDCPFMRVEWLGVKKEQFGRELCYAIKLGKVLEVKYC